MTGFSPSRGVAATKLPLYEGTITLSLRHDVIEKNLRTLNLSIDKKFLPLQPSAFRPIHGYYPFSRFRDRSIKIRHKESLFDIQNSANRITKMLTKDGFKWFEKYSNLEVYEHEINSAPYWTSTNLFNNSEGRAYRGTSVAAVLYGRSHAAQIAEKYLKEISRMEKLPLNTRTKIENNIRTIIDAV